MTPLPYAIDASQISKRYGGRLALSHVDLKIESGQSVLLTGNNGSGKTTLLRILSTALSFNSGCVRIFGMDAPKNNQRIRQRIGLITHDSYLYEDFTVRENLGFAARANMASERYDLENTMTRLGLLEHEHRLVRVLSAGLKRRTSLARMLFRQPDLLLLDEPFGQLDENSVQTVTELIQEQQQQGKTVMLATHDVERGRALCDMHCILCDGKTQSFAKIAHSS